MQGVFLDTDTLNPDEMDFAALEALMPWIRWAFEAEIAAQPVAA